jgi:starvation-inducible outer membrane lipoprotein
VAEAQTDMRFVEVIKADVDSEAPLIEKNSAGRFFVINCTTQSMELAFRLIKLL